MDLGSPEEEESPPLMKWRETRAEEAWTWLGLHGGEDREESFLAATLNIFFELRLASSTKPVPTAFAKFWEFRKRERERENLFFRETKEEEMETVIVLVSSGSVCLSLILTRHFIDQQGPNPNKSYMSFIHTRKVKEYT